MPDFYLSDHGTICLLWPSSEAAQQWAEQHLPPDRMRHVHSTVVEHRYIADILAGISEAGLTVEAS